MARITDRPPFEQVVHADAVHTLEDDRSEWHLLLWAWRGAVEVEAAGRPVTVTEGRALWVPAGRAVRAVQRPGAVCVPVAVPRQEAVVGAPDAYLVDVPDGWRAWLLAQYAMRISPLRAADPWAHDLTDLLRAAEGRRSGAPDVVLPMPRTQLRRPRSPELRAVERDLVANVDTDLALGTLARRAGLSERTLQRSFRRETALTVREWRTALRLRYAATHLAAGLPVGVAAHRSGFESTSGFSRAFRREFGVPPSAYAGCVGDRSRDARDRPQQHRVADLLAGAPSPGPTLGASATPALVNDFHVVIWMARGGARVEVGRRVLRLEEGEAVWLPAWRHNRVQVDAGGVMLPLFSAPPPTALDLDAVVTFSLRDVDTDDLLRLVTGQYTYLRPSGYDEQAPWRAFERWALGATRSSVDPLGAQDSTAVRLLTSGLPAGQVAARLGYAHLSSFSRAFRRAHGAPPSRYAAAGRRATPP